MIAATGTADVSPASSDTFTQVTAESNNPTYLASSDGGRDARGPSIKALGGDKNRGEQCSPLFSCPDVQEPFLTVGASAIPQGFISCTVTVLSSGLYSTLKTMPVAVPAAPVAVADPGGLLPVVPALLADVFELALLELLELLRARLPITLKVTVNGSLFGLLNFTERAPESSLAESMLSPPT
jgi:hypothetical protein